MRINIVPSFAIVTVWVSTLITTGCQSEVQQQGESVTIKEIALPDTLLEPEIIRSKKGKLNVTLEAAPAQINVAGVSFLSNVYNGTYTPPVLSVARGDSVVLKLVNRTDKAGEISKPQVTNMHYHGMGIPPLLAADYIYMCLRPEKGLSQQEQANFITLCGKENLLQQSSYIYRFRVPDSHPQGIHWYHPHAHQLVEEQVKSGMSGFLMVDGIETEYYEELGNLRQRYLYLKDIQLPGVPDSLPLTKTINGQKNPIIRMRPGEFQVWNIGNIGANAFINLKLAGHSFWVLAYDGNVLGKPVLQDSVFLTPAARATVVVQAGQPGTYDLRSGYVDTGPQGDPNPDVQLARLEVTGTPVPNDTTIANRLTKPADKAAQIHLTAQKIRDLPITRSRVITFSESADGKTFFVNGKGFDAFRTDVTVNLGDVEKWIVRNVTGELHVFHIHQIDFLVTAIKGKESDATGLRDVVDVPYQVNGVPGEVEIIIPFTDPAIVGRFPFHCHILEHEDSGMMANLVVKRK